MPISPRLHTNQSPALALLELVVFSLLCVWKANPEEDGSLPTPLALHAHGCSGSAEIERGRAPSVPARPAQNMPGGLRT